MQRPPALAVLACSAALLLAACAARDAEEAEDDKPPSTPSGVSAQAGSATSVHVMWDRSSDNQEVTGYEVYREGTKVASLPGAKRMVDIDGLAPRTAYRFTVRARDAAGNVSGAGAAPSVTTPSSAPDDRRAPTRPGRVEGRTDSGTSVTLTWRPATDGTGVTSYDIYQEDSRVHSVSGTRTSARVTGLRPGTVYTFTVRARDAAENSSPDSNSVDLTTPSAPGDDSPNTAPTDLEATVRKGSIELRWTPPDTGAPVEEHRLYLNGEPVTTIVWGGRPPVGTAAYTMSVTDPPGTRYSIKLRARLPDGKWGDFSAQRTVVVR
ncbi:fibronectin type III domain-containing protein [Streptomyces peucetius]|uniref:Fibronectin type III domain-containing protein n=1 Tax=Streptomyces peucetius TaxID=1950 RepID=A0ABY6IF27_STRPE|nr:fibronectin type III domain-containing protein [Streptomyces peucetius]UYQ65319.1 fibronectin type III domain-containing protein [Streptomyces peucetius]